MDARAPLPEFRLDPSLSGLETARRWIEQGFVAGFTGQLRVRPIHALVGEAHFVCEVQHGHANFLGLVHGGVTAALVDITGGTAALTLLEAGETLLTTDLNVRYLNAASININELRASSTVSFCNRRKAICDVKVTIPSGEVVVLGSVSVALRAAGSGRKHRES